MIEEFRKITSTKKDIWNFALVIGGFLLIIGIYHLWKEKPHYLNFIVIGLSIIAAGKFIPVLLKPFQYVWMVIAVIMGFVMTRIILSVLFYLILTPTGMILRLLSNNKLNKKTDSQIKSYWLIKEKKELTQSFYERQF